MTANRTQSATKDSTLILELKIDANGEVYRKATKLARKDTLEGKLLAQLYPGIHVARVSVPMELTPYEQSLVENRMAQLMSVRAGQRRMASSTLSTKLMHSPLLSAFSTGRKQRSSIFRS